MTNTLCSDQQSTTRQVWWRFRRENDVSSHGLSLIYCFVTVSQKAIATLVHVHHANPRWLAESMALGGSCWNLDLPRFEGHEVSIRDTTIEFELSGGKHFLRKNRHSLQAFLPSSFATGSIPGGYPLRGMSESW